MLARMKMQTTGALTEICLTIPSSEAEHFCKTIESLLALAKLVPQNSPIVEDTQTEQENQMSQLGDGVCSVEELFPNASPAMALRGLRVREGITQKQLADCLGISQTRVSELETGARAISLAMAKRIAEAYKTSYKIFL
ncbi:MAG: helix-turn-helix transcriptional regulator [Pseudomonadota bacterium]